MKKKLKKIEHKTTKDGKECWICYPVEGKPFKIFNLELVKIDGLPKNWEESNTIESFEVEFNYEYFFISVS